MPEPTDRTEDSEDAEDEVSLNCPRAAESTTSIDESLWIPLSEPEFRDTEWSSNIPPFQGTPGSRVDTAGWRERDYFNAFFPEHLFHKIVEETNRYADQQQAAYPDGEEFRHTTKEELEAFVAYGIAMGLCHKNNLKDYWAETSSLTSTPEFGTYMSRNRFSQLRSNLHFNNNELRRKRGHPDYDPLYKVRPIIDAVMPTYLENYVPNREVSVDECMGKFRGRVFFRQYIPRKSCTYGMKVWCLNDAVTSMCLNWRVYIGEKAKDHTLGLSAEVLLDLCRPIYDTSRVCFQDMHFTSPTLALKMKEHGLGSCGTVRHDHVGMPDAIKNNKLKLQKGDPPAFLGHGQTGMLVASWQDVKRVNILSTVHKNNVVGCSGGRSRNLQKPQMCADYNKFSGGVDRMDQVMGYYQDKHRNKKHYMAVFQFAKEVALHNGYLLYKETRDHPVNPKKFREIIITQLLESYISSGKFINPKKRRRLTQEDTTPRRIAEFNPRHYLDYNGKRNDCVVCSDRRNGQRKSSVYWCPGCAVHLCLPRPDTNCFYRYHTLKNYKV